MSAFLGSARRQRIHRVVVPALALGLVAALAVSVGATGSSPDPRGTGSYAAATAYDPQAVIAPGNLNPAGAWVHSASGVNPGSPWIAASPVLAANGIVVVANEKNEVSGICLAGGGADPLCAGKPAGTPAWGPLSLGTPAPNTTCPDYPTTIGVTATPALSADKATAYLAYTAMVSGAAHQFITAINTQNGAGAWAAGPHDVTGTADNDATVAFNAATAVARAGLVTLNGFVYAAYASICDTGSFRGWVAGENAATGGKTALWTTVTSAGNPATGAAGGGIDMSGGPITTDGTNLYLATGKGTAPVQPSAGSAASAGRAQSVVKLQVGAGGALTPVDSFTPTSADTATTGMNAKGQDLGSTSVALLPAGFSSASPGAFAAVGGQNGRLYLMNASALGGRGQAAGGTDNVVGEPGPFNAMYGALTGFTSSTGSWLYTEERDGHIRVFVSDLRSGAAHLSSVVHQIGVGWGSGAPVVTSAPDTFDAGGRPARETALLWLVRQADPSGNNAQLVAYRAVPNGGALDEVWASTPFTATKYARPLVTDDGWVVVGDRSGQVRAWHVTNPNAGQPLDALGKLGFADTAVGSSASATLHVRARVAMTITSATTTAGATDWAVGNLPLQLGKGAVADLPLTFAPTAIGARSDTLLLHAVDGAPAPVALPDSTVTVSGNGLDPGSLLAATPSALDLGAVAVNRTASGAVTVQNGTSQQVVIQSATTDNPLFGVTTALPAAVSPGTGGNPGTVQLQVTFAPTAPGTAHATLTLATSAGTRTVALSGTATSGPPLVIVGPVTSGGSTASNVVDLGATRVGTTVATVFDLVNRSGSSLTFTNPTGLSAPFAATGLPQAGDTLVIGGRMRIQLRFHPTRRGVSIAVLTINASDGPHPVVLTGAGLVAVQPLSAKLWHLAGGASRAKGIVQLPPQAGKGAPSLALGSALRGGHLRVHLVFSPGSAGYELGLTPTSKGARPALAVLVDPAHHRIALARGTATGWALIGRWLALPRVPTMTADLAVDGPIVTLKLGGRQIARAVRPALPGAVRLVVASLKGKATGVPAKLSRLDVLAL